MRPNQATLAKYEVAAKKFCVAENVKPDENIEQHCSVFVQNNFVGPRWQHVAVQMDINSKLIASQG